MRSLALILALAMIIGCGGKSTKVKLNPQSAVSPAQGNLFPPHRCQLTITSDGKLKAGATSLRVQAKQTLAYSWLPKQDSLEFQVHLLANQMTVAGQPPTNVKWSRGNVEGVISGQTPASLFKVPQQQLTTLTNNIFDKPFCDVTVDGLGRELSRKVHLGPSELVLVDESTLEYAKMFLAPGSLDSKSWETEMRFPGGNGIFYRGRVTFEAVDEDWTPQRPKWFVRVKASGELSADGKYDVPVDPANLLNNPKTPTQEVAVANSSAKITGDLVYSRQTHQFVSGTIKNLMTTDLSAAGQRTSVATTLTVRLDSAKPLVPLPLPKSPAKLDEKTVALEPRSVDKSLQIDSFLFPQPELITLDLAYADGIITSVWSADAKTLYVLANDGALDLIDVEELRHRRRLKFNEPPKTVVPNSEGLVVVQADGKALIVLDPIQLTVRDSYALTDPVSSTSSTWNSPWLLLTAASGERLAIYDLKQKLRLYSLDAADLRRAKASESRHSIEKLHDVVLLPDASQFVCSSTEALHRFAIDQERDLFYEEDGFPINPQKGKILASADSRTLFVGVSRHKPIPRYPLSTSGGIYGFDLTGEKPLEATSLSARLGNVSQVVLGCESSRRLTALQPGRILDWNLVAGQAVLRDSHADRLIRDSCRTVHHISPHPTRQIDFVLGAKGCVLYDRLPKFPRESPSISATVKTNVPTDRQFQKHVPRNRSRPVELKGRFLKIRRPLVKRGGLVWSRDAKAFYILTEDGMLEKVDSDTGKVTHQADFANTCDHLTWSRAGLVVTQLEKKQLTVLDPETLEPIRSQQLVGAIWQLVGTPDSNRLLAVDKRTTGLIWIIDLDQKTMDRQEVTERLRKHANVGFVHLQHPINLSPDGKTLLLASSLGTHFVSPESLEPESFFRADASMNRFQLDAGRNFITAVSSKRLQQVTTVIQVGKEAKRLFSVTTPVSKHGVMDPKTNRFYLLDRNRLMRFEPRDDAKPEYLEYGSRRLGTAQHIFPHPTKRQFLIWHYGASGEFASHALVWIDLDELESAD